MDDRKEVRFHHPDGRTLVVSPVPGKPFAYTTRYCDGTTIFDTINKAFEDGNFKNAKG